ncbi:LCP family protein [Phormidesmis priestleyi]|uniref:LCP family protein n=1 Tax=Phormidesmis priestleyi TaxID=268141 RepID=UPI000942DA4C|nr:LCP family protein [Phormidesmis priestleyi]
MSDQKQKSRFNLASRNRSEQIAKTAFRLLLLTGVALISATAGALVALTLPNSLTEKVTVAKILQNLKQLGSLGQTTITRPVNILVLGIDNSGHLNGGSFDRDAALRGNSDLMLLVRLIPQTHEIHILSIPRDTLVQIPGRGIDKVNDANMVGGAALAGQTTSRLLNGIPLDRYIRVDTGGFVSIIDALGGVEVTVPKQMDYDDKSQNLRIHLNPGLQRLNGQHLQEYVRFRHDELGDISRIQRQQEVLKAIQTQILQPATLLQLPHILKIVQDSVDTNLSAEEKFAVAQFLWHSDRQHLQMVMLPGRFSRPDEYDLSYWIENREAATPILAKYFSSQTQPLRAIGTSPLQKDQLRVRLASSIHADNLLQSEVVRLQRSGFLNTELTDQSLDLAAVPLAQTQIIAQRGDVAAAKAVKAALGFGQVQVASTGDITSDITVVLGTDAPVSPLHKK